MVTLREYCLLLTDTEDIDVCVDLGVENRPDLGKELVTWAKTSALALH